MRKKLLIIGPVPPPLAGPEIVTRNIVQSASILEHFDIVHLNTNFRKSNAQKGRLDLQMVLALFSYLGKLLRILIVEKIDVVLYLPTSATKKGWVRDGLTILLSWISGKKVLLLFQGGHFRYFFNDQSSGVQALIRFLINRCRLIFVQAESLKKQFIDLMDSSKVLVLPNALAEDYFESMEAMPDELKGSEINLLFVGHRSHAKGYNDLLKVFSTLAKEFDVRLLAMGALSIIERNVFFNQVTGERIQHENPEQVYAECIAANHLNDKVEALGSQVFGEAKLKAFRRADIFVLPSYSEGFSTAILEAMAAGLPIVTTRVGAAPDVLAHGKNGFLLVPGQLDELKSSLAALITDKALREEMGQRNLRDLREKYLVENVNKQLAQTLMALF